MKLKFVFASALAAAAISGAGVAQASIVSVGAYSGPFGLTIDTPPPGTAITSDFIENNNLPDGIAFAEKQNYTLLAPLDLDTGGTLAAGTVVSSYFIGFDDPVGGDQHTFAVFSTAVLGIEYLDNGHIGASDVLGLPSLSYNSGCGNCNYEAGETATFTGHTASFTSNFSQPGDYARVITAGDGVPEPAAWALLVGGFGLAGAALRRRLSTAAA